MTSAEVADHPEHATDRHVAHHFESAQQQFDAGKLGMWLFLVTEVLFFSGLFVAYAVYRSNHPEVFVNAHKYLNTTLGALNTIVLLFSSLTMAWAVRCSQLGQKRGLVFLLAATLACASFFLGVKAVEYSHKWGEGLLWAGAYSVGEAEAADVSRAISQALTVLSIPASIALIATSIGLWLARRSDRRRKILWASLVLVSVAYFGGLGVGQVVEHFTHHQTHSETSHDHSDAHAASSAETQTVSHDSPSIGASAAENRRLTGVFFSIYYAMTGVHAVHILAGMGVIGWLLLRSLRGDFSPAYFGPVDYVGLYWHLVDLVWIYLFPLLYLIR